MIGSVEPFAGRRLLLCVGGGIAAYKACEVARLCGKAGAQLRDGDLFNIIVYETSVESFKPELQKFSTQIREEALRYVYLPTVARDTARRSALRHMVSTFFAGSVEDTVAALLDISAADLSQKDLERISNLIEQARKEGEQS